MRKVQAQGRSPAPVVVQTELEGHSPTGAAALYHALKRYTIDRGQAAHVGATTLLNHTYDGNLEDSLDGLGSKLSARRQICHIF